MGHYWSEMQSDPPERNPKAIDALGFREVGSGYSDYNQYYHVPCLQMFYINRTEKLPEPIWNHVKDCK